VLWSLMAKEFTVAMWEIVGQCSTRTLRKIILKLLHSAKIINLVYHSKRRELNLLAAEWSQSWDLKANGSDLIECG
jgi:hypothetical protein